MATLLIVEDDETIGHVLDTSLRSHGHHTSWQRTGHGAIDNANEQEFELALLDLGLPDLDGVEVCRQLRAIQPNCVLVILTARHDEMDVIVGLDAGADDYLTKPVHLRELLARIRAHLRRAKPTTDRPPTLTIDALRIDTGARRAYLHDQEIPLRAKEFDLLTRLASEPNIAISRETLITDIWDEHWFGSTKTLDVHIAALRRKLGPHAPTITTLRGHGYRLEHPPHPN